MSAGMCPFWAPSSLTTLSTACAMSVSASFRSVGPLLRPGRRGGIVSRAGRRGPGMEIVGLGEGLADEAASDHLPVRG